MYFYVNKKRFNIKNDEKENKLKIETVLLQAKQQGSEVLKPGA